MICVIGFAFVGVIATFVVASTAKAKKRHVGIRHLFESRNTTSSQRTRVAHTAAVVCGVPRTRQQSKRDGRKQVKLASLEQIAPSPEHMVDMEALKGNTLFFSGTVNRIVPNNPVPDSTTLSAVRDLKVVNTLNGARMVSESGDTIFVLVPRCNAIEPMSNVQKTLGALKKLDDAKTTSEIRGKTRIPCAENDGKYVTVGLKPNRGKPGVVESWPNKLSDSDKNKLQILMRRCQHVANGYIRSAELRGLRFANLILGWCELAGATTETIWASLAAARNHYLNSHTDEDFFYSLLTIVSEYGLQDDIDRYKPNAEVCNYFTFAEQGVSVALRPGDILLFNPVYGHCLSSRTSAYETKDVFSLSMYLKTAIVGKNDNSLPLTDIENRLLW
jgi:hypothetical protein